MINKTQVFLRADGNSQIGLGHVHRLLALSEILQDRFACAFIIHSPLPGVRELVTKSCATIIELNTDNNNQPEFLDQLTGKEIVVLDGYNFGEHYQQSIKSKGSALVCIDDIHATHFVADAIINPAGGVNQDLYSVAPHSKLFTGPRYALLKKPFRERQQIDDSDNSVNSSLLISMGGADPDNHTLSSLRRSLQFDFQSIIIVIGEAYKFKDSLMAEAEASKQKIEIVSNLDAASLADKMRKCSTAICSASGVAYEYASIGGRLYLKRTASNQELLYNYFIDEGIGFDLQEMPVEQQKIERSRQIQKKVFDGNSGKRLKRIFNNLDFRLHFSIRKATSDDLLTFFEWANEVELRDQSYHPEPIALEAHEKWFGAKISDLSSFMYVIEYKLTSVAQIRFDIKGDTAIISYSIDKAYRGIGWGLSLLELGMAFFHKDYKNSIKIVGYVKRTNESSNILFHKLKFTRTVTQDYPDSYKYEL